MVQRFSGCLSQSKSPLRIVISALLTASLFCTIAVGQSEKSSSSRRASEAAIEPNLDISKALRPCSFKNVTPGETETAQVLERLGAPAEDGEENGQRLLIYHLEPFHHIEVVIVDGIVASIVLHFANATAPAQIERELQLHEIESTPVYNDSGQVLGRAYPERGALLNFDQESKAHRAMQLVLEPVAAEPFVLRVRNDTRHQYTNCIADLEIARRLEPGDAETVRMLAELLAKTGQPKRALEMMERALALSPGNARLMLEKAELLARIDQLDEALEITKGVVADRPEDAMNQARAEKLLGDLLTLGAERDFSRAVEHHMAAIKLATPLASDKRLAHRRAAKELLVKAYLAAAMDIACGEWQAKEATTDKWLASARELSESMITHDQGDPIWRLHLALATLAAYAENSSSQSQDSQLSTVTKEIQRLNDVSGDDLFRRELNLLRVRALFDASSIAHRRGQPAQARELANQGIRIVETQMSTRELTPADRYLIGRLYFFVGSSVAVADRNHAEAVKSYEHARKYLSTSPPKCFALDLGRQGERFVSMGASYFESGNRELGMRLTREGLETMREAADAGIIKQESLVLPYTNLAAMYKVQGKSDESRELVEMASRIETTRR